MEIHLAETDHLDKSDALDRVDGIGHFGMHSEQEQGITDFANQTSQKSDFAT